MMYPFLRLDDNTEIVHSEWLDDNSVKVYIEKPVNGGFYSAVCYLPSYEWSEVDGFNDNDLSVFQEILESTAHLIIRFAREGGLVNAASV